MTNQEMKVIAKEIFESVEDVYDKDTVCAKMIGAGIPFHKCVSLYKTVGVDGGFIQDTADIKEKITKLLQSKNIVSFDTFDEVEKLAEDVIDELDGAPRDVVFRTIRTFCKESEIEIPRKPRVGGPRGPQRSKIGEAAVNYAFNTPKEDLTREGLYAELRPLCKNVKAAVAQVNTLLPIIFCVANEVPYDKGMETVDKIPALNTQQLEANEE